MPVDRVDSAWDLQDAPRSSLRAAEPWQMQRERQAAERANEEIKFKKQAQRQKRKERKETRRRGDAPFRPNYAGPRTGARPIDAWKLASTAESGKVDSEHIGTIAERVCLRVKIESSRRIEPTSALDRVDGNTGTSKAAEGDSLGVKIAGSARWLITMVTDDGDRVIYQAGEDTVKPRVGAGYLVEATIIAHTRDNAQRAQTIVGQAQIVPMVGKCVARGTLRQWSDSGPAFVPSAVTHAKHRPCSVSSFTKLGVSKSLLSNTQISHPWGRGTAPRSTVCSYIGDSSLNSLGGESRRARQEAVQTELSVRTLSSLLEILRERGADESTISEILEDQHPQLAAAKLASTLVEPFNSSRIYVRKSPSAATSFGRAQQTRPFSAGAVAGSRREVLANEETCMQLLRKGSHRPHSATPALAPRQEARRHSLTTSAFNRSSTGLGVSYSIDVGAGQKSSQATTRTPTSSNLI